MIIDELIALFRIAPDQSGAREAQRMIDALSRHTARVQEQQNMLAGASVLAMGAIGVGWARANMQFESLRASLDLVTGGAEQTAQAMAFLQEFAVTSPDQLTQITAAYQMLVGQGLDPTAERLTALGDAAAAVQVPVNDLIDAMASGAIGTTGRLDEMFGRFGMNFMSRNGTLFVSIGDEIREVGNSFRDVETFVSELGRTRFAGGMARQAATISGAFANLQDTVYQLMVSLGDGGVREEVQQLIREFGGLLSAGQPVARLFSGVLVRGLRTLVGAMGDLAENQDAVRLGLLALASFGQGAVLVGLINQMRQLGLYGAIVAVEAAAVPLAIGAAITATTLLIDDFANWIKGEPSVIGAWVGTMEDGDPARQFFLDMKEHGASAFGAITADLAELKERWDIGWNAMGDVIDRIAERLRAIGTAIEDALPEGWADWLRNLRESNRARIGADVAAAREMGGTGEFIAGGLMDLADRSRGRYVTDAQGNQVERGALDPSTWAGGPGLSGLRERNRAALDLNRSRIDPEGVAGVRSRVASGVPVAAPPGTVGRRAPVSMSGTRVEVTIQSQGPLDTDGIVRELAPRMPRLLQDALQDAYDRAEEEVQ